ncbi:MAG: DUF4159 domain-containing protein [Methylacidiphilales bacterium]|nr:DUF4159 domain-containing protein [Candidatus Methylacidiphilales bacterium]
MPPPERKRLWEDKLVRSSYFLCAVLLHLVIFLMVATWIVFQAPPVLSDNTPHITPSPLDNPQPQSPVLANVPTIDPSAPASNPAIHVPTPNQPFTLKIDPINPTVIQNPTPQTPPARVNPGEQIGPSPQRVERIQNTVFHHWHRTQQNSADHDPAATFPVYVAAYADGDWACNSSLDQDGNIVAGSIPNLAAKIKEWSHGQIKGEVSPKPLNIGSRELLDKMPLFIFFTGHKDFVLTEQEVDNLRDYLEGGGAIWGDNALAGQGSRFDVAFHREMKRVVGEKSQFEPVPADADIFAKSWFPISQVPEGMNHYAEPMEHLDIDGIVAVLYTPNDYSDMMDMRILPGDTAQQLPYSGMPPNTLFTNYPFWSKHDIFYRNFTLQSSLAVHRLGMNIVDYLLTRFDDLLLLTP